jgi:hypothetical protein
VTCITPYQANGNVKEEEYESISNINCDFRNSAHRLHLYANRKGGRMEPENRDHVQRTGGDPRGSSHRMGRPSVTSSRFFSKDEKTVYATILAIPNYRLKATDETVITFRERPAGEPEALRAWFYPGRNWGMNSSIRKRKRSR